MGPPTADSGATWPTMGAVAGAGEATICHQSHIVAQTLAYDGGGNRQHLLHSGAALGSFVADDYDVPRP